MNTILGTARLIGLSLLLSLSASAHPGHGDPGPAHYVTEPDHVVPVITVATAIVVSCLAFFVRRKRSMATVRERSPLA